MQQFAGCTASSCSIRSITMRGFIWVVLALLLFLAWVGSYIVYHVEGLWVHLLLVFAVISLFIDVYSEIKKPRD